jgi:hypothetical protein
MRILCSAVLLAMSTAACSSEVSVASQSPAATEAPEPAVAPATPSSPSSRLSRVRTVPIPEARAERSDVTTPTYTRGAIIASELHGSPSDDVAMAVARDASSNVVTTGRLGGSADVGCGTHASANGGTYVVKKDPAGACVWAVYFDGSGFVSSSAVAVAADGSIFVTGSFDQTATFDAPRTSAGGLDGFLVKLASTGTMAWTRTFGSVDDEYPYAVTVSGSTVAVGGAFYGTMSLVGGVSWTSRGDADAFVATYGTLDGVPINSRAFGGPGWDAVNALTFDVSARLIAAGTHAGGLDLGLGTVATAGGQDGFVATYDSSLVATGVRSFGGAGADAAQAVIVDASSSIIIAGYFSKTAAIGAASPLTGSGANTAFWASYAPSLAFGTAATLDADGSSIAEALTLGPTADIVIGGQFTGTTAAGALQMSAGGSRTGFVASFAPVGTLTWNTAISGSADTEVLGMVPASSSVVAVGSSNGTLVGSTAPYAGGSDALGMTLGN